MNSNASLQLAVNFRNSVSVSMRGPYLMENMVGAVPEPLLEKEEEWSPSIFRIYKEAKDNYLTMVTITFFSF